MGGSIDEGGEVMNEVNHQVSIDPQRVDALIDMFQTLKPESLSDLDDFYAAQAVFKDPFNAIVGRAAIRDLFAHMFDTLQTPHFVVHDRMLDGTQVFLTWSFYFKVKGIKSTQMQVIEGSSYLRWSMSGDGAWTIDLHRDYWDAAQELYEKFPVIGWVLRHLRKRLASPSKSA